MCPKRKLVILTIAAKVNIISEVTKSGKPKNEIAKQFNIPPSTLSTILKNKNDILRKYETDKSNSKIIAYLNLFVFLNKIKLCNLKNT